VRSLAALLIACAGILPAVWAQAPAPSPGSVSSPALAVAGDVKQSLSLSLADLGTLPRQIVRATNEHTGKQETYQGVAVAELLKRAGVPQGTQLRGADLAAYLRAEGADGYVVTFSLAELDSSFQDSDILVADTLDGQPLPDKVGPLRLVVPHDKRPGRWVRELRSLTVVKLSK